MHGRLLFATATRKGCAIQRIPASSLSPRYFASKPGVATPEQLRQMVAAAGDRLVVLDVRNVDEDGPTFALGPLPDSATRPLAYNAVWDRAAHRLETIPVALALDTPIITHCGSGGRGQKAKEYLESKGYTNVLNGGEW